MIDQRTLDCFAEVARLRNFRAAAARLNTTQPAVSARIAALERRLGVKVLTRTTRSVALTPEGRVLLGYVERLVDLRREMIAAVVNPGQRTGTLRLGVAETIVHSWLPDFLERASVRFPLLSFEVEVDNSLNLRDRLLGQDIDLAFLLGPMAAPGLSAEPLFQVPNAFIAKPGVLPRRRVVPLAMLVEWPLITFARQTEPYVQLMAVLRDSRLLHRARVHASASVATIARMALDGLGVALLPAVTVTDALKRGELVAVRTDVVLPLMSFEVAWHTASDPDFVRTLVELAHQAAASLRTTPKSNAVPVGAAGARRR